MCWDAEICKAVSSTTLLMNEVGKPSCTLNQIILVREAHLWCVTSDSIVVIDTSSIKVKNTSSDELRILKRLQIHESKLGCALTVSDDHIWMGLDKKYSLSRGGGRGGGGGGGEGGAILVWNTNTYESKVVEMKRDAEIQCMITAFGSVWVGDKHGRIIIMGRDGTQAERELHIHEDLVKSICATPDGHVVTGSGSKEGKVCVWNAMSDFDMNDGHRKWVSLTSIAEVNQTYEVVPIPKHTFTQIDPSF